MPDYAMLTLLAYDEVLHENCIVLSRPSVVFSPFVPHPSHPAPLYDFDRRSGQRD